MRFILLVTLCGCADNVLAPPSGPHYHYVISRELIPTNNTTAREYALDLNADGTVDNQIGMALGLIFSKGFDPTTATEQAIDRGEILMLADLQTPDLTNAETEAGFRLLFGINPRPAPCVDSLDVTCRHHLNGDGVFDIESSSVGNAQRTGVLASLSHSTQPLRITVAFLGRPLVIDLIGAIIRINSLSETSLSGSIGGGVTNDSLNNTLIPAWQSELNRLVERDCPAPRIPPNCGCVAGAVEGGRYFLGLLDSAPKDCVISVDEIRNNSLVKSAVAPDLVLDGQRAISLGIGFQAVSAQF